MRIGVTGHQRLDEPARWNWVEREVDRLLASFPMPLIGVSSLAIGADQLFARAMLRRGGLLEVIVPFSDYESTFRPGPDPHEYNRLLDLATSVDVLERCGSDEEAYLAAGKRVVDRSDFVIAVWDGKPAAGLGGTGDIVTYIAQQRKPALHFNPVTEEVKHLGEPIDP